MKYIANGNNMQRKLTIKILNSVFFYHCFYPYTILNWYETFFLWSNSKRISIKKLLFIYLFICLFIYFIYLFIYLSIYLFIFKFSAKVVLNLYIRKFGIIQQNNTFMFIVNVSFFWFKPKQPCKDVPWNTCS